MQKTFWLLKSDAGFFSEIRQRGPLVTETTVGARRFATAEEAWAFLRNNGLLKHKFTLVSRPIEGFHTVV
jgi:hypothetical protein